MANQLFEARFLFDDTSRIVNKSLECVLFYASHLPLLITISILYKKGIVQDVKYWHRHSEYELKVPTHKVQSTPASVIEFLAENKTRLIR